MFSIQTMPATAKWDDLSLQSTLDSAQLNQMAIELDLVTIALAALTQIDRGEMQQIARDLQLESTISAWIDEWPACRSTQAHLDADLVRSIVLVVNHLAQEYQVSIRRNIYYWQQTVEYNLLPLQSPSLADYIDNFIKIYQVRLGDRSQSSFEALSETALNLSIELLFYSSPNGHQRLWKALLERTQSQIGSSGST
jgi:hypothetical protein